MCLLHTAYEHAAYLLIVTLVLFVLEKRLSCCIDWSDNFHTRTVEERRGRRKGAVDLEWLVKIDHRLYDSSDFQFNPWKAITGNIHRLCNSSLYDDHEIKTRKAISGKAFAQIPFIGLGTKKKCLHLKQDLNLELYKYKAELLTSVHYILWW